MAVQMYKRDGNKKAKLFMTHGAGLLTEEEIAQAKANRENAVTTLNEEDDHEVEAVDQEVNR